MPDSSSRSMEIKKNLLSEDSNLLNEEKLELLFIAREAVKAAAASKSYIPSKPTSLNMRKTAGAFVTLKENGELRGCIGLIEGIYPLYKVVAEMAQKAATCDPRFESVRQDELQNLELEISVLSALKRIRNFEEVEIGRHGLLIEKGIYRGLLLPQVATENHWGRETFLEYTCMKAGLDKESYKDPDTRLYVFSADVFSEKGLGISLEEGFAKGN